MPKEKELKAEKGSVLKKDDIVVPEAPDYTDEEREYLSALQQQLETAQKARDQNHEEFDSLTFIDYYQANEKGANTIIEATSNKEESQFQSGTLRTKMMALLSSWTALNMKADISAFNEHEIQITNLGNAMETVVRKTEEYENDEEQRMLRQFELLKQGFVFCEELWEDKWQTIKDKISGLFGQRTGVKWRTRIRKTFGVPRRRIISPLSVYLGNMRQYFIDQQPYVFTVEIMDYDEAKAIYEDWEMWKAGYVSKEQKTFSPTAGNSAISNHSWRLFSDTGKGKVEVIKYQAKQSNEFQIVLNGVPMLPLGYPLTEVSKDGEYTIVQQNLEPIRHDFAYGKSFIFKNKNIVAVLDMMMKLAVLKTKKSFLPPLLNMSQRLISRDVLLPGRMTRGINKGDLVPIFDTVDQGVTMSEFNMIEKVTQFIDRNTVSQTFTGAREPGGKVTATQINELQRQARLMMGLMELAAGLLEKKLCIKRLGILLDKWFEPLDKVVDEARTMLKNRYRYVSEGTTIQGKGRGLRIILAREEETTPQEVGWAADNMTKYLGMPVELMVINPLVLKNMRLIWQVSVVPKEKKSSDTSKIMFNEMAVSAGQLAQMGMLSPLNKDYMDRRFAEIWQEDPGKMFERAQPQIAPLPETPPTGQMVKPQVRLTPEGQPSPAAIR